MYSRFALTLALLGSLATLAWGLAGPFAKTIPPPFVVGWQEGHCIGCQTAHDNITVLGTIQFVNHMEAWALGVSFPVHEGVPDYTVLHTSNAGRTWSEVTRAVQTHRSPAFSFSDPVKGWIASWNFIDGPSRPRDELIRRRDPQFVRTSDGGQHWGKVSDRSFDWIQFFRGGLGYGTTQSRFLRTNDGGETWTDVNFSGVSSIDRLFFLSANLGWIAGWSGRNLVVYRTIDGGSTWLQSQNPIPIQNIRDLWFYDSQRGWLITQTAVDNDQYLFNTVDGGKTWRAEPDRSFRGIHHTGAAVRWVSKDTGFVFENEVTYTRSEARTASNTLRYTTDGGAHWNSQAINYDVQACQVFDGDILCSATLRNRNVFGILTVHPTR